MWGERMEQLKKEAVQTVPVQRRRVIEQGIDEMTGRLIGQTDYRPEGFVEAFRQVPSGSDQGSVTVQTAYSLEQRWTVFQEGFAQGRALRKTQATRPAANHMEADGQGAVVDRKRSRGQR